LEREEALVEARERPLKNEQKHKRKEWQDPELKKREKLPRVTNGFAGSFKP